MDGNALEIHDLQKSFRRTEVLHSVDLAVPTDSIFGFLGPIGSGKSTTLKIIMGLLRPSGGRALVFGEDVTRHGAAARARIGFLPQDAHFHPYRTCRDVLSYVAHLYPGRRPRHLWRLSAASFGVDLIHDGMWGIEFAPDASVDITVDGVGRGPYATDGYGQFHAGWDPADLDLVAGNHVEVTDGDTTKTHDVTDLVVTDVDDVDDTVSGTAAPGSDVDVWVHDSDAWRRVAADGVTGAWTVDFSVAGAEPNEGSTADLIPGSNGNSGQCDDDGDCTPAGWEVPGGAVNEPPTGSATPAAQSIFYREVIDPFVVAIDDVDSPQVDATASWAQVGEDPQPGLPPGLELIGTPCTGDASVACTVTVEGELRLPAGDYSLELTLDDGEDSSVVAMTVTVNAEHDELNAIRADLNSLIDGDAFTWKEEFRARLARAYLGWAARSTYWDDGGHPDSHMTFLLLRAATHQLTKIRPGDTSQPEAVAELAERMVDLTRRSALSTIDQAVDADGSQRQIDRAVAFLERGDDKRAAGRLDVAVSFYHAAWYYATSAF